MVGITATTNIFSRSINYKDSDNFMHDIPEEIPCEGYEKQPVMTQGGANHIISMSDNEFKDF